MTAGSNNKYTFHTLVAETVISLPFCSPICSTHIHLHTYTFTPSHSLTPLHTLTPSQERKKTHKALELKKVAELKCDSLHERNSQLQRELGTYRSQLKTAKKRARELELNESQIPSLRAEFDREQSSLVGEASALRRQLEETQDQLRREAEMRMKADLATGRARQGELCVCVSVCVWGGRTRET